MQIRDLITGGSRMKAYSLGLYEKAMPPELSWREKLETAKEAGYDYVEISIDETEEKISRLDMTGEERFEMVSAMYETGLPIRTMCVSALTKYSLGNDDPQFSARGMEILEKSIRLADDLGVRVVMIPGYDVYYRPSTLETKRRYLRNLKRAAEMAEKAGVILGLETMENEFMNTVEKAMKYVTFVRFQLSESLSGYRKSYKCGGSVSVRRSGQDLATWKRKYHFHAFKRDTAGKIQGGSVRNGPCGF